MTANPELIKQEDESKPKLAEVKTVETDSSQAAAILGIVFSCISISALLSSYLLGLLNEDEESKRDYLDGVIALAPILCPAFSLIGSIALLKKNSFSLAKTGAICMLIPFVGTCFGLTLPLGIWQLVILNRAKMFKSFEINAQKKLEALDESEEFLSHAAKLDRNGQWEKSLEMYQDAAKRWPDQKQYADNCITEIKKKMTLDAN